MLLLSIVLALLPLIGIAYLTYVAPGLTVDWLFTSLILLTISGIFGFNVLLEAYKRGWLPHFKRKADGAGSPGGSGKLVRGGGNGLQSEKALIQSVEFYEANIGQHDKSVVMLKPVNSDSTKLVVFLGDLRNALQAGRRAVVTYRSEQEGCALVGVNYV